MNQTMNKNKSGAIKIPTFGRSDFFTTLIFKKMAIYKPNVQKSKKLRCFASLNFKS